MENEINLNVYHKLSLLSGLGFPMPKNHNKRHKCFRFLWNMYVIVPNSLMILGMISQGVQMSLSKNSIEILTTCTLSFLYILQFVLKIITFRIYRKSFYKVFNEIIAVSNSLNKNPLGDEKFIEYHNRYYLPVKYIGICKGIIQLISAVMMIAFFCVLSWIGMKRATTPAFSWTPFDSSENPEYTLTCLFEMICYGTVTLRGAVLDLLFWVLIIVPAAQQNYLKYLMGIILRDREEDEENGDGNVEAVGGSNDEFTSTRLIWWIKHHQRVLSCVQEFDKLASVFLGINYLTSLVNLFMSGFVAISSTQWDILQRIFVNAIIIADVLQLYFVSLAGDMLCKSSEAVTDNGFTVTVFIGNKKIKNFYLFALTRTVKQVRIRFGGVNPLSSQTFLKLIQMTLSYFVTIIQIRYRVNENTSHKEEEIIS